MPKPENPKSTFENVVNLLSVSLWPLIVIIVFFMYHSEVGKIIKLIPEKLENSSKISVGSLSFEIQKTAAIAGNEELGKIIKNLSEKGIRRLLTLGTGRAAIILRSQVDVNGTREPGFTIPHDYDTLLELEKDGLLNADESLKDFLTFFNGLNPIKSEVYVSEDGLNTSFEKKDGEQKMTELSIPLSKLSAADSQRIDRYGVELSKSGKQAFGIIVKVISGQIKKD